MAYNSSIILGAFTLFLVFGYLSVLRSIARVYFPSSSNKLAWSSAFKDSRVLANFGSSALFISIPATSLLLFWGWAPALLWLLIAHLLLDSILHLQVSAAERIHRESTNLISSSTTLNLLLQRALLTGFYGLLTAIVLSFLTHLIDRQSGLIFALLCLLPAHQLLQRDLAANSLKLTRVAMAVGAVLIGVMFAHQLGFAIYGEWQPLHFLPGNQLDWLALNNQTIIAAGLLIGCTEISRSTKFEHDFAVFTGVLLVLASLFLATKFLFLQASLDAPINVTSSDTISEVATTAVNTPPFALISLILFWSLGGLLLRLTNENQDANIAGDISSRFGRLQWESLLQLLFSLILLLSLAAAIGIGAWNSHYLGSSLAQDLVEHFDLAVSSISALLDSTEQTGSLINTFLLVGLMFAGFCCLIAIIRRLNSPINTFTETKVDETVGSYHRSTRGAQKATVFLLSCYFIKHGVQMQIWVFVGCLAWILFAQLALGACEAVQRLRQGIANTSFANYVILSTILIGFIQSMSFVVYWLLNDDIVAASLLQLLIFLGISTWWRKGHRVIKCMKESRHHLGLGD